MWDWPGRGVLRQRVERRAALRRGWRAALWPAQSVCGCRRVGSERAASSRRVAPAPPRPDRTRWPLCVCCCWRRPLRSPEPLPETVSTRRPAPQWTIPSSTPGVSRTRQADGAPPGRARRPAMVASRRRGGRRYDLFSLCLFSFVCVW